jgi:hypothetical protein
MALREPELDVNWLFVGCAFSSGWHALCATTVRLVLVCMMGGCRNTK